MQARIEAMAAATAAATPPGIGNPAPTVVHPWETDSVVQPACPLTLETFHILYVLPNDFVLLRADTAMQNIQAGPVLHPHMVLQRPPRHLHSWVLP